MTNEDCEQIRVVDWIKHATDLPVIHIANQRSTSPRHGALLKRMGVRSGVSDLFIPRPCGNYHGLFVELKTLKGRPTDNQKEFNREMHSEGYEAVFAYGADEAIMIIKDFYDL